MLVWLAASSFAVPCRAQERGTERVSLAQALKEVLPASAQYLTAVVRWTPGELARARQGLGRDDLDAAAEVVLCYSPAGTFVGYAVVAEERGPRGTVTFLVGVRPDFSVAGTAVMAPGGGDAGQAVRAGVRRVRHLVREHFHDHPPALLFEVWDAAPPGATRTPAP